MHRRVNKVVLTLVDVPPLFAPDPFEVTTTVTSALLAPLSGAASSPSGGDNALASANVVSTVAAVGDTTASSPPFAPLVATPFVLPCDIA